MFNIVQYCSMIFKNGKKCTLVIYNVQKCSLMFNNVFLSQDSLPPLGMALRHLTEDEKEELKEQFSTIDKDESGFIELGELKEALDLAGFKVPGWRVRDMIDK